jgi:hypothetical protein
MNIFEILEAFIVSTMFGVAVVSAMFFIHIRK